MKIYSKKKFAFGVFCVVLGATNLILDIVNKMFDIKGIIIVAALLLIGVGEIMRSLSQKMTREDKLEGLDERNKLIALKSKGKAFQITQMICFCLMLSFFVIGKVTGEDLFISIGMGIGFAYSISLFTELFTYFYYEKRN